MAKDEYGGGMGKGSHLRDDLKRTSVPETDESMKCRGGSVNDEAVRGSVAPTPKTLGPRTDG